MPCSYFSGTGDAYNQGFREGAKYKIGQTVICAKFDETTQTGVVYTSTIKRVFYNFKGSYTAYELTCDGYKAMAREECLFSSEGSAFDYLQTKRKESLYGR